MRKVLFLLLFLLVLGAAGTNAQVRIGGDEVPNEAAVLDLNATDAINNGTKGLVLPRVNFSSNTALITSGVANLTGMLVYNTNTTLGVGVYYWDDAKWVKISDGLFVEVDGIVGNEVTDATSGGGLVRAGLGTAASPYTLGIATGGVVQNMIADKAISEDKMEKTIRSLEWSCETCSALAVGVTEAIAWPELGLPDGCTPGNVWYAGRVAAENFSLAASNNQLRIKKIMASSSKPSWRLFCYN